MANVVEAVAPELLAKRAKQLYAEKFPTDTTDDLVFGFAPGRVNLIGEHTDYCEGFVFPMAIDFGTVVAGKFNGSENKVNFFSAAPGLGNNGTTAFEGLNPVPVAEGDQKWSNYARGCIEFFHDKSKLKGFNAVAVNTVPLGGGVSSSASLEVGMYTFLEALTGSIAVSKEDKAKRCQKCEHVYAGVPCGIMDQMISATAQKGKAMLLDCKDLSSTHVSLPDSNEAVVLVINSNVKHELVGSEYSDRRNGCIAAAAAMKGEGKTLRDCSAADICPSKLTPDQVKYARHVTGEIARTAGAKDQLAQGKFEDFGKAMCASHASLRDDFGVSCAELDQLVELAGACDGVYGTRMTGGGFGGCTVTLVKKDCVDALIAAVDKGYTGKATFFVANPSEGARQVYPSA